MGQSGGPTAVINASICGVIQEAMRHSEIEGIYGARHGILGLLHEDLIDMRREDSDEIELLKSTPAAALGSIRHKLPDPSQDSSEYERIFQIFEAHNIRYFFYAGGNDSMDTINKISAYAAKQGYELRAIGIPKTVDNDLAGIDHCPGYGSVAKHIAAITMGVGLDMQSVHLTDPVIILEVMGRNAGWMTASSALPGGAVEPRTVPRGRPRNSRQIWLVLHRGLGRHERRFGRVPGDTEGQVRQRLVRPPPARRSGAVSRRPRARRARPQDATHPDGSGGARRHAFRLPHRPR